jgi:hypothetical protein
LRLALKYVKDPEKKAKIEKSLKTLEDSLAKRKKKTE